MRKLTDLITRVGVAVVFGAVVGFVVVVVYSLAISGQALDHMLNASEAKMGAGIGAAVFGTYKFFKKH